jgi:2,4-dienoyl-CoA reductase-like NADH-dependent reductase (Old Yellow Enzyme family)
VAERSSKYYQPLFSGEPAERQVKMSKLFTPFKINKLEIKNRFVRSATVDNLAKDTLVSEAQQAFYREMTRGEVGLIISSGLFPSLDGWAAPGQLGIHQDDRIPSLKKLVQTVHENGGKVAAQIMHAGWFGNPKTCGLQTVGPSAMLNPTNNLQCRELSSDEVYQHIEDFIQAGRRAYEAGFDAVQIHGAHGWLVSAFLSPVTNRRQDEWGGSPEKRAKFVVRIIEGIRKLTSQEYPILIKMGLKDYHPQGKTVAEGISSIQKFIRAGLDAVEVSEGVEEEAFHHIRKDALRPYYLEECRQAKKELGIPVILVGGMRQLADIRQVVDGGIADAVSMCRPFIMDQHIVQKFHQGTANASKCTSCNSCIAEMHKQNIHCVFNERLIQE